MKANACLQVLKANKNKASETNSQSGAENNSKKSNGLTSSKKDTCIESESIEPSKKKQKILEKITYEDLDSDDKNKKNVVQLNLSKVRQSFWKFQHHYPMTVFFLID